MLEKSINIVHIISEYKLFIYIFFSNLRREYNCTMYEG